MTDSTGTPPVRAFMRVPFSFRGRIGRAKYWLGLAVVIAVAVVLLALLAAANNPTGGGAGVLLGLPLLILFLWMHLAVMVKRLRDAGFAAVAIVLYALAPIVWLVGTAEFIEYIWPLILIVLAALFIIPGLLPSKTAPSPAAAN